jgi:hypothetical protein
MMSLIAVAKTTALPSRSLISWLVSSLRMTAFLVEAPGKGWRNGRHQ